MREADARKLFNLRPPYTQEDVLTRFRELVKAQHPDMGGRGMDMAALVEAKALLLSNHAGDIPCIMCDGVGQIKGRLGMYECTMCQGDGVVGADK